MTLKYLLSCYPELDDLQIIKLFFQKNGNYEEAIKLLSSISYDMANAEKTKMYFLQDYHHYNSLILDNDMPAEDKIQLFKFADTMLKRQLDHKELSALRDILIKYKEKDILCPIYVREYACPSENDFSKDTLQSFKKIFWEEEDNDK